MENITHNVVVPPEEETSIVLGGNFEQNTYSNNHPDILLIQYRSYDPWNPVKHVMYYY